MQHRYRNRRRIDEGLGSAIGKFLTKLLGRSGGRIAANAGSGAATRGLGSKIGKLTLAKGAAATGLGAAGAYGIDKLTSSENGFDGMDIVAKLTSDIQSFGRAVDLNNDLSAECRSKVKEYMKDIEEMLTQDLERHERYFSGYNDFNSPNNGSDYGNTNTYRDNTYAPGHRR